MTDLQLPANWQRWNDDELRAEIARYEKNIRDYANKPGESYQYFARLFRARLHVLRNELDRRIDRQRL